MTLLFAVATAQGGPSEETPPPSGQRLSRFVGHLRALAAEGGRWQAENPDFTEGQGQPRYFTYYYRWALGGQIVLNTIGGTLPDGTKQDYWYSVYYWDRLRERGAIDHYSAAGAVLRGTVEVEADGSATTTLDGYREDGSPWQFRDTARIGEDGKLSSTSFDRSGSHWKERRRWIWRRTATEAGPVPSEPAAAELPESPDIVIQVAVEGGIERVFELWTSEEGVARFFGHAARIEARPGGAFEMAFAPEIDPDGSSYGSKGCRILELERPNRLVFEWPVFLSREVAGAPAGPPVAPELRSQLTTVAVELEPDGSRPGRVLVRLTNSGYRSGDPWWEAKAYFWPAWAGVLGRLAAQFAMEEVPAGQAG